MPAQPKSDTLARLLELLQAIPHRRYASPEELTRALNNRGYAVHVRTVQRDLQMLREHLPLDVRDDSKPHGWGWRSAPPDGIAGIGASEALMVALVERHMQAALPANMMDTLKPTFDRARLRLERLGQKSGAAHWASKVAASPAALVGLAPKTLRSVREALSEALLQERQVDCSYRAGVKGAPKRYRLHPLGIVLRGNALYLVATKGCGTPAAFFALHRFESAEACLESVSHQDGLTLEAAMLRSRGQFGVPPGGKEAVGLELRCDAMMAAYLEESPLGAGQLISPAADGWFDVQVTVPDSWELRWWVLSRVPSVEVVAPSSLRHYVATSLRQALARYEG